MSDLNTVCLTGRLIKDPELKYTPAGVAVATLCISVQGFGKDEQGRTNSALYNLTAWKQKAEFSQKYLVKGNKISVTGGLESRSWVDQATGMKRTAVSVRVDQINNLTPRNSGDSHEESGEEVPVATTAAADEPINDPFSEGG